MPRFVLLVGVVTAALSLVGCGGGGDELPGPPPETRSGVRYEGLRHVGPWGDPADHVATSSTDGVFAALGKSCLLTRRETGRPWATICPGGEKAVFDVVTVDPDNPHIVFAVRGDGSVFRSTDGGTRWSVIGEDAPHDLEALAVGGQGALYAGGWNGLFRSASPAQDWQLVGEEDWWITSIAVDPVNPNIAYAGGSPGLVRTEDAFESWEVVDVSGFYDDRQVDTVAVNPASPRMLLAVDVGSLHRSLDRGLTWRYVRASGFPNGRWYEHRFAVDPGWPQTLYLVASGTHDFATGGQGQGEEAWLMRSRDFGDSWRIVARAQHENWLWADFWALAVSPSSGNVYVGDDHGLLVCSSACMATRGEDPTR